MMPDKPRFRHISAAEAHLRQSLLGALCGVRVGEHLLRATVVDMAAPDDAPWFLCAEDIGFRILHLNHRPIRMDAAEGPAMAMLLDGADTLLSAVEAALGLTLEPADIGPRPQAATIVARIETMAGDARTDLALSADAALLPTSAPFGPALLGDVPVPLRLSIAGPRLSPTDAATLAPGDMLLLGSGAFAATLQSAAGGGIDGRIDPAARLFQPR